MSFVFLSAPFTPPPGSPPERKSENARLFWGAVAQLISEGEHVVSPLTLLPATQDYDLPDDWGYWREYCLKLMRFCDRVVVLMSPGWELSSGVRGEVSEAESLGLHVKYVDPSFIRVEKRREP